MVESELLNGHLEPTNEPYVIAKIAGIKLCESSKPDGTPGKLMDVSRLERLGWKANISLKDGLGQTYGWFLQHASELRAV